MIRITTGSQIQPPKPETVTLKAALADANGDHPRTFNIVGGGQSRTMFKHAESYRHESSPGVRDRAFANAISRHPRSYKDETNRQSKRHLATVVDSFLRDDKPQNRGTHQEVQVAHDSNDMNHFIISTNTQAGNEKLRERFDAFIKYTKGEPTLGSSARQIRHHKKWKERIGDKAFSVITKDEEGIVKGKHAERRLFEANFLKPAGVMRPCGTCWSALDNPATNDPSETGPGQIWTSGAANPPNEQGEQLVSNSRTRVTVGHDNKFHNDYDTESDSEIEVETRSDSGISDADSSDDEPLSRKRFRYRESDSDSSDNEPLSKKLTRLNVNN